MMLSLPTLSRLAVVALLLAGAVGVGVWLVGQSGSGTTRISANADRFQAEVGRTPVRHAPTPESEELRLAGPRTPAVASAPTDGPPAALARLAALAAEPFRPGGVVVAPDGSPVVGARVALCLQRFGNNLEAPLPGRILQQLVTDDEGRFQATLSLPAGRLGLWSVQAEGWPRQFAGPLDPLRASDQERRIVLGPGATLAGLVLDGKGQPLANAEVRVYDLARPEATTSDEEAALEATFHTDAAGQFRGESLAIGRKRVSVLAAGHARQDLPDVAVSAHPQRPLRVRLTEGATLEGRVVDLGGERGLEGFRVSARPVGREGVDRLSGLSVAKSGFEGRFRLEGLPAGALTLTVTRDGAPGILCRANAQAGGDPVDLRTDPGAGLEVFVTSLDDGGPITEFSYRLVPAQLQGFLPRGQGTPVTSEDGALRLDGVQPGLWRLQINAPGFGPLVSEPLEVASGALFHTVLRLDRGIVATGYVRDPEGNPVSGARVVAQWVSGQGEESVSTAVLPLRAVTTAADGSYVVTDLAAGRHRFVAEAPGHAPGASDDQELVVVSEPLPVPEIVLERTGRVVGQVVKADGQPDAGAIVSVAPDSNDPQWIGAVNAPSTEDGRFEVPGLRPGRYLVRLLQREGRLIVRSAQRRDPAERLVPVEVRAGHDAILVLREAR